jgi:Ca2+-dependent lipid-binding protein
MHLTVHEGKLIRDTEAFGHMDPFVMVTYNSQKFRTKVLEDAGKKPKWEETLEIPIESLEEDRIKITCYDEDVMMDDFVGEEEFSVSDLC